MPIQQQGSPLLFIVSGPAGSGKTTLCERLLAEFHTLQQAITATTRAPRPGEKNGFDYYFLSKPDFEEKQRLDEFLESATVHGRSYGTLRSEVFRRFERKMNVLLNIDVQGMRQIREEAASSEELRNHLVSIFILPPSLEELRKRLLNRKSDDAKEIERRLQTAKSEIRAATEFDYILETGSRDKDYDHIRSIYLAELMRNRTSR